MSKNKEKMNQRAAEIPAPQLDTIKGLLYEKYELLHESESNQESYEQRKTTAVEQQYSEVIESEDPTDIKISKLEEEIEKLRMEN